MSELARLQTGDVSEQVLALVRASRAPSTLTSYAADWRRFEAWCVATARQALPASPTTIAEYLSDLVQGGKKVATIERARVAIGQAHVLQGEENPTKATLISELMKGVRRTLGVAQREARPIELPELRAMVLAQDALELGTRNRAMLVLGFLGAMRRSELVALDVDDVHIERRGLIVHIRRSKTDQEGRGARIGLPVQGNDAVCPVACLQRWLEYRRTIETEDNALFVSTGPRARGRRLHDQAVWRLVLDAAARAGVPRDRLSAHSLRAGFATAAAKAGKPESTTRQVTRHRSIAMLLRYVRIDDPLERDGLSL
jgi:site-specific recombinase XerD